MINVLNGEDNIKAISLVLIVIGVPYSLYGWHLETNSWYIVLLCK